MDSIIDPEPGDLSASTELHGAQKFLVEFYKKLVVDLQQQRCAGFAYPDEEAELREALDDIWNAVSEDGRDVLSAWLKTVNRRATPNPSDLVSLDGLVEVCGHFTQEHDNGYGCTHEASGEVDSQGRRSCHGSSCPLACTITPESEPQDVEELRLRGWTPKEIEDCTEDRHVMLIHDEALLRRLWVPPRYIVDPTDAVVEATKGAQQPVPAEDGLAQEKQRNRRHTQGWVFVAAMLLDAGFTGDSVADGVRWLTQEIEKKEEQIDRLTDALFRESQRAVQAERAVEAARRQFVEALRQKAREVEGDSVFWRSRRRAFDDASSIVEALSLSSRSQESLNHER